MFFLASKREYRCRLHVIKHQRFSILANRRVAVDKVYLGVEGGPDGCCIDEEDKLWVAFYGGSCILRIDPNTGIDIDEFDVNGLSLETDKTFSTFVFT